MPTGRMMSGRYQTVCIVGVGPGMAPDIVDGCREIFLRQRVVNDHIPVLRDAVMPLGRTLEIV
jgi:hypothetical protein